MDDLTPAEVREVMLYARPGEGEVSFGELHRRRDGMRTTNPVKYAEYRSASRSVKHWQREYRSASRSSMNVAEFRDRLADLEDLLHLEPGTLTR
jgi:hypothetical protein